MHHRLHAMIAALQAALGSGQALASSDSARRVTAHLNADTAENGEPLPLPAFDGGDGKLEPAELSAVIAELRQRASSTAPEPKDIVLVVEDDRLTARIHADALAALGDTVLVAGTAAEAEAMLHAHAVSIVLLDLVLPDGDGRDLLARLRAAAATRSLPIIVITARIDAVTQAECFALGADVLLSKPVDPHVLTAAVATQLDHAAELRVAGRIDRLTGLPNRAALLDSLQRLVPLSRRNRQPVSIAMIDLDFFKAINDTYGHDMGDEVLRRSAQTIAGALRVSDLPARWGGEEFCVVLPDTGTRGAVRALQKALDALRDVVFTSGSDSFSVTFSAGVAQLNPKGSAEDAIKEADQLLYRAKETGRNRVFSVHDEADPPRPRVLLVEDDHAVSGLVTTLLKRHGFDVVHHADGSAALQAAESEHFVLAIVDIDLPLLDGFTLISRLRAMPTSARMPVLLLTGLTDEDDIVRGFEVGANDYVTKPFLPRELAARVNRLLPRR